MYGASVASLEDVLAGMRIRVRCEENSADDMEGEMRRERAAPRPVDALDGVSGFRANTSHNRRTP